jgi:hypothetical protein
VKSPFACISLSCALAAQSPEIVTVQIPSPLRFARMQLVDVDSDGNADLVTVCTTKGQRELRIWRRRAESPWFAGEPEVTALDKDVAAFAFVRRKDTAARTLVLFTPERAVAAKAGANGTIDYEALFAHRIVWPAADPGDCIPLQSCVRDLDGDGLDDLVLPEPDGARPVLQKALEKGSSFSADVEWRLPSYRDPIQKRNGKARRNPGQFSMELGEGDERERADPDPQARGPLAQVRTRSAPMAFVDFDGDQRTDCLALRNEQIWLWPQAAGGAFAPAPKAIPLPLPEDRLPLFDPAFDVQLRDVDRDGRADLVLTTSAQRNDEIETRVDLYRQRAEGSPWATQVDSRLRLQTLAGPPQLVDADGDGGLDLVALTVRTDLLRGLQGGAAALDVQLNVYRGDNGRFALPALITQKLQLTAQEGKRGGTSGFARVLAGSKDTPGSVLLHDGKTLQLRPLARDGRKLTLGDAVWKVPIGEKGSPQPPADDARELLIANERELLFVRWQ